MVDNIDNPITPTPPAAPGFGTHTRKRGRGKTIIPHACMKRLAMENCGGMRISSDTVDLLEKATEQFVRRVVQISRSYTSHRGRKTLTPKDVEAALDNFSLV